MNNSLLATLSRAVYQRLLAAGLEPVTLKFGEVLHEPGVPIRGVYFPIDCVIALLMPVMGREAVEVGLVGHEGMVGSPLALGSMFLTVGPWSREPGLPCGCNQLSFAKKFCEASHCRKLSISTSMR